MNQEASAPRIQSIKVTGLFGMYDHHVILKDERVTVIHGPNGVGKTVFLKLIDAFFQGHYHEMLAVPFERFEVIFVDNSIGGLQCDSSLVNQQPSTLFYTSPSGISNSFIFQFFGSKDSNPSRKMKNLLPLPRFQSSIVGADGGGDLPFNDYSFSSDFRQFRADFENGWYVRVPEALANLLDHIYVHLIQAQRLIRLPDVSNDEESRNNHPKNATNTVDEYSSDLKHRLESALADYAKKSQKLDQTFPQRLIQHAGASVTLDQLKLSMEQIEAARSRLKMLGILDRGDAAQESYPLEIAQFDALQPEQISVMAVYADDTTQKLAVLEELAGRVEILLGVLNRKFTNKQVSLSRDDGLSITGRDGKPIPVNALSSGEQHELVLLYDLLFKVKPNTLVLIDEPELSLHISWQKSFMDDLLDIIRLAQFDVLMATHSPYIVGEHSDLLVELSSDVVAKEDNLANADNAANA